MGNNIKSSPMEIKQGGPGFTSPSSQREGYVRKRSSAIKIQKQQLSQSLCYGFNLNCYGYCINAQSNLDQPQNSGSQTIKSDRPQKFRVNQLLSQGQIDQFSLKDETWVDNTPTGGPKYGKTAVIETSKNKHRN